ncbi:hypothetical protein [uncultured Chryseobacterium sp.]|uniref:hypothetical protein n=1 Tax=uncultured Chryseobacterium sp. TaxID=259322 RepID=UPI0025D92C42|nr:hypothetical protein [uncultured Chryseobacterium sp.]
MNFKEFIPLFSDGWKQKYQTILAEEHLKSIDIHVQKFKDGTLTWDRPFFNEEIKPDRDQSFHLFISVLESERSPEEKAAKLEEIAFEHWLDVLGQRLTSASLRDERAIPPLQATLIKACEQPFNSEITMGQRAWEKHVGRKDDRFWGEVKGNNRQKQQVVMDKISYILNHKTWWNIFFHYKHGLVYEAREAEGHGIRWSHDGMRLIGFLEIFINE